MTVYRKPFTRARIKSDAATFYLDAEITVVWMAYQEICLAILRLLFFPAQDPPDLEKDDVFLRELVSQGPVDLCLGLRWQIIQLRFRKLRNHCRHWRIPECACGTSSRPRLGSPATFRQTVPSVA
ncbi:hypothetical protein D9M68_814920 [compost metagenome]